MKHSELFQLISRHFSTGRLTLPATAFGQSKVAQSILNNCAEATLILDKATEPQATEKGVTLQSDEPLGLQTIHVPCTAHAHWWIDEQEEVQMNLQFQIKEDRPFALKTLYKNLEPAFIRDYSFSSIGFEINTSSLNVDFNAVQAKYALNLFHPHADFLVQGPLSFKGQFEWPESLEIVRHLFANDEAEIKGQIRVVNGVPQYVFVQPGKELSLGHLTLKSRLEIIGVLMDSDSEITPTLVPDPDAVHALITTFEITDDLNATHELSLSTTWQASLGNVIEIRSSTVENLQGKIVQLLKKLINVEIELPEIDGLPLLESFHLQQLQFGVDVATFRPRYFGAQFTFLDPERPFEIIKDVISLSSITIDTYTQFSDNGTPSFSLDLGGKITLSDCVNDGGFEANISLPSLNFDVGLEEYATLDADKLLRKFIPDLPEELSLKVTELKISGSIRQAAFSFAGRFGPGTSVDFGPFQLLELGIYFDVQKGKTTTSSIALEGVFSIQEELGVQVRGALSNDGWEFKGSLFAYDPINLAQLLPKGLQLPEEIAQLTFSEIDLKVDLKTEKEIEFTLKGSLKLAIPEMGEIEVNQLQLRYTEKDNSYSWSIESKGSVRMIPKSNDNADWLVNCGGTLTISGTQNSYGISFKSSECTISEIPLLIPYKVADGRVKEWSSFSFGLNEISLEKKDTWTFTSLFKLKLTKAPKQLRAILGEQGISVKLVVDATGAEIGLDGPVFDFVTPHDLWIPAMGEVPAFNLGKARFQIASISVKIGKTVGLNCTTKLWLPERTNHLFGTEEPSRNPKLEFFEVYNPNVTTKSLALSFTAGFENNSPNFSINISDLPIKPLKKQGDHFLLDLGPIEDGLGKYGSIKFTLPQFGLDLTKGGIEIKGEFELLRDFAIPLDLLKKLLKASVVPQWADILPDALPIPYLERPKFFENEQLNIPAFKDFHVKLFNKPLPVELERALLEIAKVANKIPNKLKRYLELPDVSGLKFEFTLRPDGSVNILLEPKGEIKLLSLNPPLALQGITLRSFSFGTLFAGQLFTTHIDADFEQFDLIQLGLALLAPESSYDIIGDPKKYGTKLELHKLSILIFYQAGFPIPVPLFYDRLGIDYYGIGGFAFQGGVEFKQPSLDLKEIGSLLNNLTKFISQKDFPLPTAPIPDNFDLSFNITPTYLTLPPYLGGKTLGLTEGLRPPTLYQTFASLANTLKFANLEHAVKVIPPKHRFIIGDNGIDFEFLSLKFKGEWLLTTPLEFMEVMRNEWKLEDEEAKKFLAIVPGPNDGIVEPSDKGLLAFVRGKWVTSFGKLDVVAGIIAMNVNQLRVGFSFKGSINDIFDVDIQAFVRIQNVAPHFLLYGEGKTYFKIGGQNIFEGETSLKASDSNFQASGKFELLNEHSVVHVLGTFSGSFNNTSFSLEGGLAARILIFQLKGDGHIKNTGIGGSMRFADLPPTAFFVSNDNGKVKVGGAIGLGWTNFNASVLISAPPIPGENQQFTIDLNSESVANLLNIRLFFNAESNTMSAVGLIGVKLLGQDFISGQAIIDSNGLNARGKSTFRIGDILQIDIELRELSIGRSFRLHGGATLRLATIQSEGTITITEHGVGGSFTIAGERASLHIRECHGLLLIVVNGKLGQHWIHGIHYGNNLFGGRPPCPVPDTLDSANTVYNLPHSTRLFQFTYELFFRKIPDLSVLQKDKTVLSSENIENYHIQLCGQLLDEGSYAIEYIIHPINDQPSFFTELEDWLRENHHSNYTFSRDNCSITYAQVYRNNSFHNTLSLKYHETIVEVNIENNGPTQVHFIRLARAVRDVISE